MGPAHLLGPSQNQASGQRGRQPQARGTRLAVAQGKVAAHKGKPCRGMACRKAAPASAINDVQRLQSVTQGLIAIETTLKQKAQQQ